MCMCCVLCVVCCVLCVVCCVLCVVCCVLCVVCCVLCVDPGLRDFVPDQVVEITVKINDPKSDKKVGDVLLERRFAHVEQAVVSVDT